MQRNPILIPSEGFELVDNLNPGKFDNNASKNYFADKRKIHPCFKNRSMGFVFLTYYYNEETVDSTRDNSSGLQDRDTDTG